MTLDQQIEAVLFCKTEPVSYEDLKQFLRIDETLLNEALATLSERLKSGITELIQTDTSVQLVLCPECSETIEGLRKEEMSREIGKAGAETLAIILYRGPISRPEIDRIRGVNSAFVIRNLLIRGLVERRENKRDQRTFLYAATPELLGHLGIGRREELPDFSEIMNALDAYEKDQRELEDKPASLS